MLVAIERTAAIALENSKSLNFNARKTRNCHCRKRQEKGLLWNQAGWLEAEAGRGRPARGRAGRWRLCGGWQSGGCWAVGVGRPFIPPVFDHCPHAHPHQPPGHRNYWNRGCNGQIESMKALTRLRQPSISPLMAEVVVETRVNGGVLVPARIAGSWWPTACRG